MFKSYKPKGERVRAVQLNEKTVEGIVDMFLGRVIEVPAENTDPELVLKTPFAKGGVEIPTLEGNVIVLPGSWIVRSGDGVEVLSNEEFEKKYEPAYTTATRNS